MVFAVAPERHEAVAKMFTEIGFIFNSAELTELGVSIRLDWDDGIELISPIPGATATVAESVNEFLDGNGDGVYTVVLRVPEASAAETVTERYGAASAFDRSSRARARTSTRSICRCSVCR